ncbi:hypothetical protein GCM10009119_23100 [Algoriphagus jejuensis]|uniref:Uncharacterized protein n=1 Tax=Algoriphagus jejuensis TaxID=419934 RepID=A0ABP3YFN5_9BACT
MNSPLSLSDPGAILGKTFLKIGQVLLVLLLLGCGYMAYLASEGFFTGWDFEFDSELASIFPGQSPDTIIYYFFLALIVKIAIWLAFLTWLNRKI